jgi:hypothetical protein
LEDTLSASVLAIKATNAMIDITFSFYSWFDSLLSRSNISLPDL